MRASRRLFPALICLAFLAQGVWFIGTQSFTFDEPVHILTGLEIWKSGSFTQWNDHPPLARMLFAIPLLAGDWQLGLARRLDAWNDHSPKARLVWSPRNPEAMAWRARLVNLTLGLVLALLLWSTARRLLSEGGAILALLLFAFSPNLIAHCSLATTDGAGALMTFAVAAQLVRWWRKPSWKETILLAMALGGLLLAKFYTPPLFALAIVLVLLLKPAGPEFRPRMWNWSKAATIVVVVFLIVWAGYLFHVPTLSLHDGRLELRSANGTTYKFADIPTTKTFSLPLPAGEYLAGLADVTKHGRFGHPSFFLGQTSETGGWKLYFPVTIPLKWPTAALLLFGTGVMTALRRSPPVPRELLVMMLFPALFLLLSIFSHIEIGDRHILPIYPFLLLLAGSAWSIVKQRRGAVILVASAVLFQIADCFRYAPDYLSYFNIFVDSQRSYELLSDSNLDWGQGLIALRKYEERHPREEVHLVYFGSVYPAQYGVRAQPLPEGERATGTVVISATHLSGHLLRDRTSYQWLLRYPRREVLNHTLHVFEVTAPLKTEWGGSPDPRRAPLARPGWTWGSSAGEGARPTGLGLHPSWWAAGPCGTP